MATPRIFRAPRNIIWGRGSISYLENIPGKRALIITDKVMVKLGVIAKATGYLQKAGLEVGIFDEVEPEPSINTVRKALAENKAFHPDVIVGIGGGSPIDASKGFRIFFEHPNLPFEDICHMESPPKATIPPFRETIHIAIPSTSGTGSEVSYACALSDPASLAKYPILDPMLIPDIAIVDPDIAESQPPEVLADSSLDALTNGIESYVSDKANDLSRGNSLQATTLLMKYLPLAALQNDPVAREHVHYAATIAGIAFSNSSVGICHTIADKVGPTFKLTHGRSCAIALPYAIKYNSSVAGDLFTVIARAIGYAGDERDKAVDYLLKKVCEIRKQLGIPDSYREAGIPEDLYNSKIKEFAIKSLTFPPSLVNPRKPTIEELESLFTACYQGDYNHL